MSRRFWGLFLLIFAMQGASHAEAVSADKYKPVNLAELARFSADQGAVDLKDLATFVEYIKLTDCKTFDLIKDSQFKQQELQASTIARIQQEDRANKGADIFISIPTTFLTSGYNFDTQSMDILPQNRLQRVNSLQIYDDTGMVCNGGVNSYLKMPIFHWAQLNFPVSLYRVPLQKSLAENLTQRLDRNRSNEAQRIIYANILVQIERIQPELKKIGGGATAAFVRGQVNAIDLYVDYERKVRFKRLNYIEAF